MRIVSIEGDTLKLMVNVPLGTFSCHDCQGFRTEDLNEAIDHLVSHVPILTTLKRDIWIRCWVCNTTNTDSVTVHDHPEKEQNYHEHLATLREFVRKGIRLGQTVVTVRELEAPCRRRKKPCYYTLGMHTRTVSMDILGAKNRKKKDRKKKTDT